MAAHAQLRRYLPVEVNGQLFALPMSGVTGVQLLELSPTTAPDSLFDELETESLVTVDLAYLFGKTPRTATTAYAVILATSSAFCAIVVDAVRPVNNIQPDDLLPLPLMIAALRLPFSSVIQQMDTLIPVIDSDRLIQLVRYLSPTLVMERSYGD